MDQKCVWRGGTTISTVDVGTGNCTIFWWQLYHIKWKKRITCAGATGTFNIILSNRGVVPSSYRIQSLWNVSKILWFTSFWESSITKNIWKHRMTSMGDSEKLIPNHNQSSTASLVVISWLSFTWSKSQSVWNRWYLPVLRYHEIMVIYPYHFFVVITLLFSWIIFIHDCICILTGSPK